MIGSFGTWGFASAFPLYKLWFLLDGQNLPIPLRGLTYPFDFSGGGGRERGTPHLHMRVSPEAIHIRRLFMYTRKNIISIPHEGEGIND